MLSPLVVLQNWTLITFLLQTCRPVLTYLAIWSGNYLEISFKCHYKAYFYRTGWLKPSTFHNCTHNASNCTVLIFHQLLLFAPLTCLSPDSRRTWCLTSERAAKANNMYTLSKQSAVVSQLSGEIKHFNLPHKENAPCQAAK